MVIYLLRVNVILSILFLLSCVIKHTNTYKKNYYKGLCIATLLAVFPFKGGLFMEKLNCSVVWDVPFPEPTDVIKTDHTSSSFFTVVIVLYLAVVLFELGILIYKNAKAKNYINRWGIYIEDITVNEHKSIKAYKCYGIYEPMLFGILKPQIIVPIDQKEEDLALIYLHETTHYRQKDHFTRCFLHILSILCWFNPFVYLYLKNMILLSEISVDEQVVSLTNQRYNYCKLLVDGCFNSQNSSQFLRLFSDKDFTITRIQAMYRSKNNKSLFPSLVVSLALLLTVGTAGFAFVTEPHTMQAFQTQSVYNGYSIKTEKIYLKEGQEASLSFSLDLSNDDSNKEGEILEIGYYIGNKKVPLERDRYTAETLTITAPEDGEYSFYINNWACNYIYTDNLEIRK